MKWLINRIEKIEFPLKPQIANTIVYLCSHVGTSKRLKFQRTFLAFVFRFAFDRPMRWMNVGRRDWMYDRLHTEIDLFCGAHKLPTSLHASVSPKTSK